ncbi:hypothetical protein CRG98_007098 [Punica granatum]|uniref:Uncharacterized protein n=1 Tax=Punica granatum TaxID=22663 RepID=A0A2I0KVJ5_PUNGR|nr:hypothetical protein CRG98_007098 [Punica granatum]
MWLAISIVISDHLLGLCTGRFGVGMGKVLGDPQRRSCPPVRLLPETQRISGSPSSPFPPCRQTASSPPCRHPLLSVSSISTCSLSFTVFANSIVLTESELVQPYRIRQRGRKKLVSAACRELKLRTDLRFVENWIENFVPQCTAADQSAGASLISLLSGVAL